MTWQNHQNECAQSEKLICHDMKKPNKMSVQSEDRSDWTSTDQTEHPPSLISLRCVLSGSDQVKKIAIPYEPQ